MSTQTLYESAYAKPTKIDTDAGVIRGVLVLGRKSRNKNREYTESALQDAISRGLYENVDINIDHPGKTDLHNNRPFMESWGQIRGTRLTEAGIVGDAHYLKTHPLTESILERAERFPERFGFSHQAMAGKVSKRGKGEVIESLETVKCVDLVRNPATTNTLFESLENQKMKTTLKELVETLDAKTDGLSVLSEAIANKVVSGALAVEISESADEAESVNTALLAICESVCNSDATFSDKLTKLAGIGKKPAEIIPPATDKALLESLKAIQHKNLVRDLLDEHDIRRAALDPKKLQLLESQADEASMRAVIESWPPVARGARKPLMESARDQEASAVSLPTDAKGFLAALR